jgi:hypothetical protein
MPRSQRRGVRRTLKGRNYNLSIQKELMLQVIINIRFTQKSLPRTSSKYTHTLGMGTRLLKGHFFLPVGSIRFTHPSVHIIFGPGPNFTSASDGADQTSEQMKKSKSILGLWQ